MREMFGRRYASHLYQFRHSYEEIIPYREKPRPRILGGRMPRMTYRIHGPSVLSPFDTDLFPAREFEYGGLLMA